MLLTFSVVKINIYKFYAACYKNRPCQNNDVFNDIQNLYPAVYLINKWHCM